MKIIDIEIHEVHIPAQEFNREALQLYMGDRFNTQTIVILHTDNGLEGLAEFSTPLTSQLCSDLEQLRGTNPANWLADDTLNIWLAPAIYDLVGKALEVPAYQLFGTKKRDHVPVAYWTFSQTPSMMAAEVQRAAELGYTWMKYHTDHFHNIIDQTRAMQEVAPNGFKVHFDVNFDNSVEHIVSLGRQLSQFSIAGLIEDPLKTHDLEGYKFLRQKCSLPIVFHHLPFGGREALMGLADGYMLGHASIGSTITRAGVFEAANVPFMMQNTGVNITRAMVVHMAAVFEMATLHHVNDAHAWVNDVVTHSMEVENGQVSVPEVPGLGVEIDRDRLEQFKKSPTPVQQKVLIRAVRNGGPTIYAQPPRNRPDNLRLNHRALPGLGEGYDIPIDMDTWYDDGSDRFAELWEKSRTEIIVKKL